MSGQAVVEVKLRAKKMRLFKSH